MDSLDEAEASHPVMWNDWRATVSLESLQNTPSKVPFLFYLYD